MKNRQALLRAVAVLGFGAVLLGSMGAQCSISGIPFLVPAPTATTVDVTLINLTSETVDPGLFVDEVAYIFDPPLAPGDSIVLTVDCLADSTLQTDAALLLSDGSIPSENAPLITQGNEFACGDSVTFVFTEDAIGFFTQVDVNGTLVAP